MAKQRRSPSKPPLHTGRPGLKRWLYTTHPDTGRLGFTLQRLTGIGLTAYFIAHVLGVGNVLGGEGVWETFLNVVENPLGWSVELLLLAAIGFHVVNGLRLLLAEFGFTLTPPRRPDYPYKVGSFNTVQKVFLVAAFLATVLFVILGYIFIFLGVGAL